MKGWDKESLRHSFAKKFGKAPPYRKNKNNSRTKTMKTTGKYAFREFKVKLKDGKIVKVNEINMQNPFINGFLQKNLSEEDYNELWNKMYRGKKYYEEAEKRREDYLQELRQEYEKTKSIPKRISEALDIPADYMFPLSRLITRDLREYEFKEWVKKRGKRQ